MTPGRAVLPDGVRQLVLGLDPVPFWFLFSVLAASAPFLLYKGAQAFWRLRTVTDTPTSRIQSASQGYVELSGLARPHLDRVEGPLTGRPCLWYRFRIEEEQGRAGRRRWTTIDHGESCSSLLIEDGSGQCIIDPTGAYVRPHRVERWTGSYRNPRSREPGKWYQAKGYRYVEERIEDGDSLYCLGRFETPLRGPAERDQLQRALLKVWKRDPARLARFDADGDGSISPAEWERARNEASALAERAELKRSDIPVLARLVATGDDRQPFVISTYPEEALTATLGRQTLGYTAGFVAVAVAALAGALVRFGGW